MEMFRFHELDQAPELAGVYAWYYRLEIATKDIENCISELLSAAENKEKIIRDFLALRLFRHYLESPYIVTLSGKMKPGYEGQVLNTTAISNSLISRIIEDPTRLHRLKSLLLETVPNFASPIYIGVAKKLRSRLLQHKKLIEKFVNSGTPEISETYDSAISAEERERDHSFAMEVASMRKFNVSNLYVCTMPLLVDEEMRYDLENVLNRINFPLCGRN